MKKSLFLVAALATTFGAAQAQQISPSGSANGIVKVKAKVPQLCDIKTGDFGEINFGEYLGVAKTITVLTQFDCKANTNITFSIENGTNPNSKPEERRLPLAGATGDADKFLYYRITSDSAGTKNIGTGTQAHKEKLSTSVSKFNLYYYGQLSSTQPNAVVGEYFEDLNATIDYE